MTPTLFPQCNAKFGPPKDLDESQCFTIHAFLGEVKQGSVDGSSIVVTAWMPSEKDLEVLNSGLPLFVSFLGGLSPHFVSTSFEESINCK